MLVLLHGLCSAGVQSVWESVRRRTNNETRGYQATRAKKAAAREGLTQLIWVQSIRKGGLGKVSGCRVGGIAYVCTRHCDSEIAVARKSPELDGRSR